MEQSQQTHRRTRPRAEWQQIVEQWRSSGQSGRSFAETHGLGESSLYKWAAQLLPGERRRRPRSAQAGVAGEQSRFLAVRVAQGATHATQARGQEGSIELSWPGGARLRVSGKVDADSLSAIVRAIAEAQQC